MQHCVYIVRCKDASLYTGYALDVEERLKEHNGESTKPGARYTRGRRPVELVYSETYTTRSDAQKREYELKQLTRQEKLSLIKTASPSKRRATS